MNFFQLHSYCCSWLKGLLPIPQMPPEMAEGREGGRVVSRCRSRFSIPVAFIVIFQSPLTEEASLFEWLKAAAIQRDFCVFGEEDEEKEQQQQDDDDDGDEEAKQELK